MVDVSNQRRMAALIMKCGLNRVYMPPDKEKLQEISEATTRAAVRSLIVRRYIRKMPEVGVSRGRARAFHLQRVKGRRRGPGSRRGKHGARTNTKTTWITNIRAIRRMLRRLRETQKITTEQYRVYYRMAKGGQFHSRAHLLAQMEARGDLKPLPGRAKPSALAALPPKGVTPKKMKPADDKGPKKPAKEAPKKGFLGRAPRRKEE
jgi:large subunit ribosomal protein L19e